MKNLKSASFILPLLFLFLAGCGGTAEEGVHNCHEYVDLGLSSGLKWATCNVGAERPQERGELFSWGDIQSKADYTSGNTILYGELWYSIDALRSDGIIDKESNLTREYDAAAGNWGGEWRMPSSAEMEELFRECNIKTESDSSMLLEGPNGNTIMIHKTGYWTATAGRDSSLTARCFNDNGVALMERYSGLAVRPVCD